MPTGKPRYGTKGGSPGTEEANLRRWIQAVLGNLLGFAILTETTISAANICGT